MEEVAGTDWIESTTIIVAAYGAILATGVAAYNGFSEWKRRKPNVKVEMSMGFIPYTSGEWSENLVILQATNPGEKAVTLNSMGLILPNKTRLVIMMPQSNRTFPHRLVTEESCNVWMGAKELAEQMKASGWSGTIKISGYYTDEVGRRYKSKPRRFDINEATLTD